MKIRDVLRFVGFFYLAIILFFVNIFLGKLGVYNNLNWFDIPMHFLGGLFIAHGFSNFLSRKSYGVYSKEKWFKILFIISFVALVAVFWEFGENLYSFLIKDLKLSLMDTMQDLFFGIFGAFIFCITRKQKNG